jgi:hypothetical protein
VHKGLFEALECTRAYSKHWSAQGRVWSIGGALRRHKELEGAAAVHIEEFEPCKCSTIVDVLVSFLKVLI